MAFGIAFSVTPDSTAIEGSGQPSRRNATDARARRWYASAGMAARRTSTSGRAATVRVLSFRVHLKKARSVRPNAGMHPERGGGTIPRFLSPAEAGINNPK